MHDTLKLDYQEAHFNINKKVDVLATKIEDVYEVFLPAEVRALLQQLRIIISLGIEGVPLACVGADGYQKQLLFWSFAPLAIATLIICIDAAR